MSSVYVTVTQDCEDLANRIFPRDSDWEITDEDYNNDGSCVVRYEFNGSFAAPVERALDVHPHVVSYQILP